MHNVSPKQLLELRAAARVRETTYTMADLTEDQIIDLASGFVPASVTAMARTLLDWIDGDRRKADARATADQLRKQRGRGIRR